MEDVVSIWRAIRTYAQGPNGYSDAALAFLVALHGGKYNSSRNERAALLKCLARFLQSNLSDFSKNICLCDQNTHAACKVLPPESRNRRLVLFKGGRLGLAPCLTQQGDTCAIILGTRFTFILRGVPGHKYHYKLVGAAYVQSDFESEESEDDLPLKMGQAGEYENWRNSRVQNIVLR